MSLRCVHEASLHADNCFVTLTYSPERLPRSGSLDPDHLELFWKRLRRKVGKLRYYAIGEYGEQTGRPHYHALIFGYDFPDKVHYSRNRDGLSIWTSELLDERWGQGECKIGSLTPQSAGYTCRYAMKKITGDQAKRHYERIDPATGEIFSLVPEFSRMSRNPGIAYGWYEKFKSDVFPSDFCISEGHKLRVPAYYDKQLSEEDLALIKSFRRTNARARSADATPTRLRVRAEVKAAQIKQLKRSF